MVDAAEFAAALGQYAAGVCLLTVRDGIDDVGTTVSSVMSVSPQPPLVAVGLTTAGYPAEEKRDATMACCVARTVSPHVPTSSSTSAG